MPKPPFRTVGAALSNVDTLLRDLDKTQQALVKQVHELVRVKHKSSDSGIFGVYGSEPDSVARTALTALFRQLPQLQCEPKWVASYLGTTEEKVHVDDEVAQIVIKEKPNGELWDLLKFVCEKIETDITKLLR